MFFSPNILLLMAGLVPAIHVFWFTYLKSTRINCHLPAQHGEEA
jgi:hypothetical protein